MRLSIMDFLQDCNLIEKSKKLVWAKFNHYTAGELRLIEVYLSRINPRDPESSSVRFTLSEYRNFLELPELDIRNVKPQLERLLGNVVTIEGIKNNAPAGEKYAIFTKATWELDPVLNQYVITISCNPELRPVFFDLVEGGYIRYRLRYTKNMRSQYSIRLYSMLRDWMQKGKWSVPIAQLREDLGALEKSYYAFKDFRKWVLDPAVTEINDVSDLNVTYTKTKRGRCITDICFKINLKTNKKAIGNPKTPTEHSGEWYAEAMENRISPESALKLAELVKNKIAKFHPTIPLNQREQAAKDILKSAYKNLLLGNTIADNPSGYLWSVLKSGSAIDNYLPIDYCIPLQRQKQP